MRLACEPSVHFHSSRGTRLPRREDARTDHVQRPPERLPASVLADGRHQPPDVGKAAPDDPSPCPRDIPRRHVLPAEAAEASHPCGAPHAFRIHGPREQNERCFTPPSVAAFYAAAALDTTLPGAGALARHSLSRCFVLLFFTGVALPGLTAPSHTFARPLSSPSLRQLASVGTPWLLLATHRIFGT